MVAQPGEIIFTSGGTESNNMAILGYMRTRQNKSEHILISKIEHSSVLKPCIQLEKEGYELFRMEVDEQGSLLFDEFNILLRPETAMISVMHANNEIGTIQKINDISKIAREHNIVFHTDSVQTLGKIPVDVKDLGD